MIDLSDKRLSVTDEGEGDAVVLLHGLGGTTSAFQPQAEALAADHRVIRIDLEGSGRSPLSGTPSVASWAADVVGVLDALGVERATFVAHSLGTLVAARVVAEHPDRVTALVALGPVRAQPEPVKVKTRERAALVRSAGTAAVASGVVDLAVSERARREQPLVAALVRESVLGQDPAGYAASCEALAAAGEPAWEDVRTPVLLLSGEADRIAPTALAEAIAAELPDARLQRVPEAGHWLSLEVPEVVTEAVLAAGAVRS